MPYLKIENVDLGYGTATVVHGLTLEVRPNEMVAILGANGAGKSTLLNGIAGFLKPSAGGIFMDEISLVGLAPSELVRLGVVLVPERRELFSTLSVETNLRLGAYLHPGKAKQTLEHVYDLFPRLAERKRQRAGTLSGGEQQMLAIGRALMAQPRLLMLDEPSIGLAPRIVIEIMKAIEMLKRQGLTILMVEQNAHLALSVADRGYALEVGQVVASGSSAALVDDPRLKAAYFGGTVDYADARARALIED
jgi:branched-chain amino acid transport system ATP-binding protein